MNEEHCVFQSLSLRNKAPQTLHNNNNKNNITQNYQNTLREPASQYLNQSHILKDPRLTWSWCHFLVWFLILFFVFFLACCLIVINKAARHGSFIYNTNLLISPWLFNTVHLYTCFGLRCQRLRYHIPPSHWWKITSMWPSQPIKVTSLTSSDIFWDSTTFQGLVYHTRTMLHKWCANCLQSDRSELVLASQLWSNLRKTKQTLCYEFTRERFIPKLKWTGHCVMWAV